jgi:NADH:ubiquinone oxidoreductase subunit 5 (subunit L)/multisubunit Na+/H+ antiporter MnhA subunit
MSETERIADEVLQRLDRVAEWANGAGSEALSIYASANYAFGVIGLIATSVFLVLILFFTIGYVRRIDKNKAISKYSEIDPLFIMISVILGLLCVVFLVVSIQLLVAPEYFAIKELIGSLR